MNTMTSQLLLVAQGCARAMADAPVIGALMQGTASRADYEAWIIQTYHYVSVTCPFLVRAAAQLERTGRHAELVALYRTKATEEEGHDRWALSDLRSIGCTSSERELPGPSPAVEAYIAWNRFTVETGPPIAFFGTAFVLEYLAANCARGIVKRLKESGIPDIERALGFLRGHADADGEHVAELLAALSRLDDPEDQGAVLLSARTTAMLYPRFFIGVDARRAEVPRAA